MPEVAVEWDLTENIMLFGRYAESAKSGGIATAGSVGADGLIYDDETAESFEIGMKGSFLDGRAELNVVAFTTEYQDLQVKSSSVTDAGILTVIGNAAEATADGVEIDGRWLLADWLTMGGSLAFLDASYDSYDGATATARALSRLLQRAVTSAVVNCPLPRTIAATYMQISRCPSLRA